MAQTYVTGNVITRLERRIDEIAKFVRDYMNEMRGVMLKPFMRRPDRPPL
ncbi:hypothetical protein [Methylobacterium sp. GC_Met_2]|nr:hypothetical protein [Methylobacterium sp. GC_Met_2]